MKIEPTMPRAVDWELGPAGYDETMQWLSDRLAACDIEVVGFNAQRRHSHGEVV